MMDAEEKDIFYYLRADKATFVPAAAIARQAGGRKRFHTDPDWYRAPLHRMVERGILETNSTGGFRLKPRPQLAGNTQMWMSPQIAAILKKNGKAHGGVCPSDLQDEESYYDNL